MHSAASEHETSSWLVNEGLKELELLLRTVLSHQADPILLAGHDHCCVDASSGASALLGVFQILLALGGGPRLIRRTRILRCRRRWFAGGLFSGKSGLLRVLDAYGERQAAALPDAREIGMPVGGARNRRIAGERGRQQQEAQQERKFHDS